MAQFRPTLATDADGETLGRMLDGTPLYASPKIDGIRALYRGGGLISRSLKPIPNAWVQAAVRHGAMEGLDGELVVGDPFGEGVFARTSSGVMSRGGAPDFAYLVFDRWDYPEEFARRREYLLAHLARLPALVRAVVVPVEQVVVRTRAELDAYEERCLAVGYEGLIVRRPDAPYKHGRSSLREGYMLKVKRFADREGVVVGLEERMHNSNAPTTNALGRTERSHAKGGMVPTGALGAFVLRDRGPEGTWADFGCGTGMTDAQRALFWAQGRSCLGRTVKYRYLPVGTVDAPRFPVFLGFRHASDQS